MITFGTILCLTGLHDYETIRDTGARVYLECQRCRKRAIRRRLGGHQPKINDFLDEE